MEGHSRRFWFDIMDGDGDGELSKDDIQELAREWKNSTQTICEKDIIWVELCDICNIHETKMIQYEDICRDYVSTFCFQRLILSCDNDEIL